MADTNGENLTRRLNALSLSTDSVGDGQGAPNEDKQIGKQRKRRTKLHDEHTSSSLRQIDSKNAGSDTAPNQRALRSSNTKTQVEGKREKQPQRRIRNPMGDPKQFLLPRPAPTAQYLSQALQPSVALQKPKKLLIILDLNGTLVHRANRKANSTFTKRPFCKQFIEYVMSEHHVMIWSSARAHNVERLCDSIFQEVGIAAPAHRWHRGQFRLSPALFDLNIQLYKQLSWVWSDASIRIGFGRTDVFNQTDTILIDDSAEKALSEPFNLLQIDEYDGRDTHTDVLGQVVEYLEVARRNSDVSSFMRSSPFAFRAGYSPPQWPRTPEQQKSSVTIENDAR